MARLSLELIFFRLAPLVTGRDEGPGTAENRVDGWFTPDGRWLMMNTWSPTSLARDKIREKHDGRKWKQTRDIDAAAGALGCYYHAQRSKHGKKKIQNIANLSTDNMTSGCAKDRVGMVATDVGGSHAHHYGPPKKTDNL